MSGQFKWGTTEEEQGLGDVTGPASSTDNAVPKYDGTGGKTLQNTTVVVSDNNDLSVGTTAAPRLIAAGISRGTIVSTSGTAAVSEVEGTRSTDGDCAIFSMQNTACGETYNRVASIIGRRVDSDNDGQMQFKVTNSSSHGLKMTLDKNGNLLVVGQITSSLPATMTPAGTTQTVNWNSGNSQVLDLESASGNVTLTLSNPVDGTSYLLKVIQDSTTPRDLVWPASVKWPGGTAPVISTGANAEDIVTLFYDGTSYLGTFSQDFS